MTPEQARALAGSYYQRNAEPNAKVMKSDDEDLKIPTWDEIRKSIANKETADYLTGGTTSNTSALNSQDDESDKIEDESDDLWAAGEERGKKDAARGQPINYEGTYGIGSNPVEITPRMDPVEAAVRQNVRLKEFQRVGRDRILNNGAEFKQNHYMKSEEAHIPTWEEVKKSHMPIEKRDPRIDDARYGAVNLMEDSDPDFKDEVQRDAWFTMRDNPLFDQKQQIDRNPTPIPQPTREDIPVNRDKYGWDQDAGAAQAEALHERGEDGPTIENLSEGVADPDAIMTVLARLYRHYRNNAQVAGQGREKTIEALGLPPNSIKSEDPKTQQAMIEPGRR